MGHKWSNHYFQAPSYTEVNCVFSGLSGGGFVNQRLAGGLLNALVNSSVSKVSCKQTSFSIF